MKSQNFDKHPDLQLVKIGKIKEKRKWIDRFIASYLGGVTLPSIEIFKDQICEFYVATESGKDCGYIRILNRNISNLSIERTPFRTVLEAYVKPPYRKRGILRFMLEEGVRRLQVQAIRIDADRYEKNYRYYQSLGFTFGYRDPDGYPSTVFHESARTLQSNSAFAEEASNETDFQKVA